MYYSWLVDSSHDCDAKNEYGYGTLFYAINLPGLQSSTDKNTAQKKKPQRNLYPESVYNFNNMDSKYCLSAIY